MGTNGAVVIGIGNRLRGDDALGPIVADALRERLSVPVREHTGESLSLIAEWSGAESVILVDAVRSGGEPGEIRRFDLIEEPLTV
jgi:hydrogenase maturation protease